MIVPNVTDPAWLAREQALCARAKRGDTAAFSEIYDVFADALLRGVLMPKLRNRAAAEDVLADTFRTAFEKLATFDPDGRSIWFWLYRIAQNKTHDHGRALARTDKKPPDFSSLIDPTDPAEVDRMLDWPRLHKDVRRVLGTINERYRRVLELRYFDERSREECAVQMNASIENVDVWLTRACDAFRKAWKEQAR